MLLDGGPGCGPHEYFQLDDASLPWNVSPDAVAGLHGRNAEEFILRVRDGRQPAMDAIVSATSRAAESIGLANEIGASVPKRNEPDFALRMDLIDEQRIKRIDRVGWHSRMPGRSGRIDVFERERILRHVGRIGITPNAVVIILQQTGKLIGHVPAHRIDAIDIVSGLPIEALRSVADFSAYLAMSNPPPKPRPRIGFNARI